MKKRSKRSLILIGIIGLLILLSQDIDLAMAKDSDYPTKPITYYVGYGAGGSTDLMHRAFCDAASKHLGQPFIVINKPGAVGVIAAVAVMNAKPDGYTLGATGPSTAIVAPLSGECPYKDISGFTSIASFGGYVWPLIVRGDSPWKTWGELMEWARKNPKAAKISITGAKSITTMGHMLWQVEKREKMDFTFISLKSSAEILSAILGGHITIAASTIDPSTATYVKEGKLRILAYMDMSKVPGFEGIPSFQELYGFSIPNAISMWAPKGIPEYILKKLDNASAKAAVDPDFVKVMNQMYAPIVYMNRVQINKYWEEITPKFTEIMRMMKAEEAEGKK